MNQIEIFYNPYRNLSRILVGNTPVAEHDALAQYQKEPFHIWCDRIFDLLGSELNDSYELTFHSTFLECEIMRVLGARASDCAGVKTSGCTVNLPLEKRFDTLMKTQKSNAQYAINLIIPSKDKQLLALATTGMISKGGTTYEMKIPYNHCSASVSVSGNALPSSPQTLAVWLSANSGDWMRIPDGQGGGQPILFVWINDQAPTGFREKQGDIYCYSCESGKLSKLLLRFLEFACMVPDFQQRLAKLRQSPGYAASHSLTLEALDSIDPVVRVSAPAAIEVGQRYSLTIDLFPAGAPCPELVYQMLPDGLVACDKGVIHALSPGSAQVTVYPKGSIEPCSAFTVTTIARNRIAQMKFQEPSLILPVGEVRQLVLDFQPEDADNADKLQWKSSDSNVVKVKQDGRIKAASPGVCTVTAEAEGVTASCTLAVQPVIQKIALSDENLRIHVGESAELKYSFSPKNAFNPEVTVRIADPTVVSYQNGKVLPRCIGKTTIFFESVHGASQAACQVEVDSSFHARQKGVSLISIAAVLCVLSFLIPGIWGTALAVGGVVSLVLGFLRGKRTVTLFMIIVLVACLLSAGYSAMQLFV